MLRSIVAFLRGSSTETPRVAEASSSNRPSPERIQAAPAPPAAEGPRDAESHGGTEGSAGDHAGSTHGRLFVPYRESERSYVVVKEGRPAGPCTARGLPVPPAHLLLGHKDAEQFLEWGELHFSTMARILRDSGYPLARGQRILDFGCGSGRLIRWLCDIAEGSHICGVDIQAEHILWCKQNLQPPFHFAVTTIVPHLPFEDNYFDLIYAGSVFTHIDDLVDSWLLELRRTLKPNGRLYVTIHDDTSASMLRNVVKNDLREDLLYPLGVQYCSYPEFVEYTSRDFAAFTIGRSHDSQVFYDLNYFCALVAPLYKVLAVERRGFGHQTAVLLQKPGPEPERR
jgi:ubiquinone/menaquinone biosynthesis C-methylase UbiE